MFTKFDVNAAIRYRLMTLLLLMNFATFDLRTTSLVLCVDSKVAIPAFDI